MIGIYSESPGMNIHIDINAEDYQRARVLYTILKDRHSCEANNSMRTIISALEHQLQSCLNDPEFRQFAELTHNAMLDETRAGFSLTGILSSLWSFITGPSQRELELGRQRKEQLERAEHAESSAFEALAESADLKKALEQAQRKIHELESELGHMPRST